MLIGYGKKIKHFRRIKMPELIECRTCKGQVSSTANACPHCGEISFSEDKEKEVIAKDQTRKIKLVNWLGIIIIMCIYFYYFHDDKGTFDWTAAITLVIVGEIFVQLFIILIRKKII